MFVFEKLEVLKGNNYENDTFPPNEERSSSQLRNRLLLMLK